MTTNAPDRTIRPATQEDADALFDICVRTAAAGEDARPVYSDPHLPGYIWAVPYLRYAPDFAFVLTEADQVIGYILGTPDTLAFYAQLERDWWPGVRQKVSGLTAALPRDAAVLDWIASPPAHPEWLQADYPAHMHIDILPGAQSSGWGRKLIETELQALKDHGVRGVHLGLDPANDRAKGFYRHLGFEDISRADDCIFAMKFKN